MLNNAEIEAARHRILQEALNAEAYIIKFMQPPNYVRIGSISFKGNMHTRKLYLWVLDELLKTGYVELVSDKRKRQLYELTYIGILLAETTSGSKQKTAARNTGKAELLVRS